ncbi:MAG TPA: cytochrome P450 [Solirubrobacteraceae bacterium]|nr:cytochrome P450 [Solirubrobacteraceae bacterium]
MPSSVQALGWALRPLAFMDRCAERYGETFTLRVRRKRPWVFLTNPEHVKQVFTTEPQLMRAGAGEANPLLYPLLGSRSLMLQDEPKHMSDRKRVLPSFHGERMQAYGEMMAGVAHREVERWPLGEPFALWPRMQAISLEVVMRATFGEAEGERLERLRSSLVELTNWVNDPRRLALLAAVGERSLTANPKFAAVMRPVEELVLEHVRARRAAGGGAEHDDILAMLEHTPNEDGSPMDDRKLRDELVTFLSDGPTATSLAWAFERLLRHPDKLERLRAETLAGESEEYVDAVVKETLRLCPAVPVVMRRLTQPMRIGGYTIPPDTIVAPCVYLMHRRADVYPNPRAFEPGRFLGDGAGTYTWIPFGGGVRRCVAVVFAQLEMKRVIQTVLSEIELRPAESRSELAARSSVSFAPDGGATVIATRRRPAPVDLATAA